MDSNQCFRSERIGISGGPYSRWVTDDVVLDGTVERFVYRAEDTSFTVARFVTPTNEQVTVVGELFGVQEGLPLRLRGQWVNDRKWGKQFKVATYQPRSPETLIGIQRFLGDGLIPGVGPALAKALVTKF